MVDEQPELDRTVSANMAQFTGHPRNVARAALDAVGDNPDRAYKLLMSEIAITNTDELSLVIEPFRADVPMWIRGHGLVHSIGSFQGFLLLKVDQSRSAEIRLFLLEQVEICLLVAAGTKVPNWEHIDGHTVPTADGLPADCTVLSRTFRPGAATVPLCSALPPLARLVQQPDHCAPRHTQIISTAGAKKPLDRSAILKSRVKRQAVQAQTRALNELVEEEGAGESQFADRIPRAAAVVKGVNRPYRTIREIGSGAFGTVHLAESADGQRVAVKSVTPVDENDTREIELLGAIQHPCVVSLLDVLEAPGQTGSSSRIIHIVMEFVPQNLHQRIGGSPLPIQNVKHFGFQLFRALAHLQGMTICHRDLKPENVLLSGDILKVADFGSAKQLNDPSGKSQSYICSRWWRAPELILGCSKYTLSVDWWSAGCILAEMMLGRAIFRGNSSWGQMDQIIGILGMPNSFEVDAMNPGGSGRLKRHLAELVRLQRLAVPWECAVPSFASQPQALELLRRLLTFAPSVRLSPVDALLLPFFAASCEVPAGWPAELFEPTSEELQAAGHKQQEPLRKLLDDWRHTTTRNVKASESGAIGGTRRNLPPVPEAMGSSKRQRIAPINESVEIKMPIQVDLQHLHQLSAMHQLSTCTSSLGTHAAQANCAAHVPEALCPQDGAPSAIPMSGVLSRAGSVGDVSMDGDL